MSDNITLRYNEIDLPCCEQYDVLVAGGGISGFSAAYVAAKNGMRTLLIERSSELGGTASLAGVANFCSFNPVLKGDSPLFDEIITSLEQLRAIGEKDYLPPKFNEGIHTFDYGFSMEQLSPLLLHMALRGGVDVLLRTELTDAICKDAVVSHAIIHNESLLSAVPSRVFIDATGDGALSLHSGARSLPAVSDDGLEPMPPAFRIYIKKSSKPLRQELLPSMSDKALEYKEQFLPDDGAVIKINLRQACTTDSILRNKAELAVRERIFATVRDFQDKHGCEYRYAGSAVSLGVRESVRILGEHVLLGDELRRGANFYDAVAHGSFIIDTVHYHEQVPLYQIPYRSLLVKNTKNLLVAGRCFSADRAAASSARIMMTACLLGQAAGAAAAISVKNGIALREIKAEDIRCTYLST